MKVNWKKVGQYILFCVLFGIGFFAFMIVAGDDDPSVSVLRSSAYRTLDGYQVGCYGGFGRLCIHGQVSEQTRAVL